MAFDTPATLVSGDVLTLARYNKLKDSIIADAHDRSALGGSRVIPILPGGGALDAPEYQDFYLPTSSDGGFTFKVEVEVLTENVATTVTPSLYNITDSSTTWTGSAGTSTAWGTYQQSTALTLAAGKRYRLQATKSNDTYDAWIIGRIVRTAA
jgi:hypothetical protein